MTSLDHTVLTGDCRILMPERGPFDIIEADPPCGDTSLAWDHCVDGWPALARESLKPSGTLWIVGSLRAVMATAGQFTEAGWCYAQELVWEKQNGSSFHAGRFKRVHELVEALQLPVFPWQHGAKPRFLRIEPQTITGRRITVSSSDLYRDPAE